MRVSSRWPTTELDDAQRRSTPQVEAAVEAGDDEAFAAALAALLDGVRRGGRPLAEDSLEDSDLILPPADATIAEVRDLLNDDGLIPG